MSSSVSSPAIFNLTKQQTDFIFALEDTQRNLALIARAGCGKTSTILAGVNAVVRKFPDAEIAVCAFNKAIADEVKDKLIKAGHNDWKRVNASTIHSLGYGLLKFVFRNPKIDEKKVWNIIDTLTQGPDLELLQQYGSQVNQLTHLGKQAGVGFFPEMPIGDVMVWHQLADHFDVDGLEETDQMDAIVEITQRVYKASLDQTDVIDFDDMILFPLIKNLRVKYGKDFLFLDEAQDLSRARQALARKFVKRNGRMIIVGDDRQAIYGFSGADSAALDNMVKQLDALILPLSVTWRCPKAVVKEAQRSVPDIQAAPEAPEGKVLRLEALPEDIDIGDAILCRNTAPLISTAYSLIRKGKPAKVEGRAIGEGLAKLASRWKIKTIDALINRLGDYKEREVQKAMARNSEAKAEEVSDKVDTLLEICHSCTARKEHNVSDVLSAIEKLFGDEVKGAIVLATYHRSKGREWDRVFLWEHNTRCPSKAARQEWQKQQERNLAYVAVTRAKRELAYVGV